MAHTELSKEAKAFERSATARMKERYGKTIPDYIKQLIVQAVDNLTMIEDCKRQIELDGLVYLNDKGRPFQHPCFAMMTQCQSQFRACLTSLMITPNSEDKAKLSERGTQNMLLDELINGSQNC